LSEDKGIPSLLLVGKSCDICGHLPHHKQQILSFSTMRIYKSGHTHTEEDYDTLLSVPFHEFKTITSVMNRGDKSQLISVHHHHHLPVPHPAPFCGWITSKKAHGSERCDIGPTFLLLFGTDDSIQNPQVAGAMMRNRGTLPHIWYVFSLIPLHSSFLPPHRPQRGKC